jgi:Asp-tRNA(Asn)/Glu-tRNA(Gln) amidotransferase C subunit
VKPIWSVSSLVSARVPLNDVQHGLVSRLARSAMLPATTTETLQQDLERIISFTHAIQAVDTANVEPLLSLAETKWVRVFRLWTWVLSLTPAHTHFRSPCPLRADVADNTDRSTAVLQNSSETVQSFFVAPKVRGRERRAESVYCGGTTPDRLAGEEEQCSNEHCSYF